jgi:hypothetical protein
VLVVLISFRPAVVPTKVSEKAEVKTQQVPEVKTPESDLVSGDVTGTEIEGTLSLDKIEGPGTQTFEGVNYRIVYKTESEGLPVVFDVLTGKIDKQKVNSLAKKIIGDITGADLEIKMMTINFYSKMSLIDEQKVDVATIGWTPNETSVKMIAE